MATYPNITWPLFAAYNDDARKSFEDKKRDGRLLYWHLKASMKYIAVGGGPVG